MPCIFLCEAFPMEDVAQMTPAVGTLDFCAAAVGIGQTQDSASKRVVKRRPTATAVEL